MVWTMLVIGSAVPVGDLGRRLHTVSGRLCSNRTSSPEPSEAASAHSTSCGQREGFSARLASLATAPISSSDKQGTDCRAGSTSAHTTVSAAVSVYSTVFAEIVRLVIVPITL